MSSSTDSGLASAWPSPDLRVVPLDSIWVHEDSDSSRFVALLDAIGPQGELENPVVVSPLTALALGNHRFVHLDGANRLAVLRALGCTHVVVQVVDLHQPQQVRLSMWAHRTEVNPVTFLVHLRSLPGVDVQPLGRGSEATQDHATAAFIFCQQGTYRLSLRRPTVVNRLATLRAVVALYYRRIERCRLPLLPEPQVVARHLATGALDAPHHVLITFVPLQAEDFLELASQGLPAPPGVTRFVLHGGRAIGLNVPLSLLGPSTCATSADDWLATRRQVRPVIVPGPCRVREYLGWRDYEDEEPLLVYHPALRISTAPDHHRRLALRAHRTEAAEYRKRP